MVQKPLELTLGRSWERFGDTVGWRRLRMSKQSLMDDFDVNWEDQNTRFQMGMTTPG